MRRVSVSIAGLFLLLGCVWAPASSASTLELAIVLDGSGSINATNWALQLNGYKNTFASGTFYDDYIAPSPFDNLYVSAYQFSTGVVQQIGWTLITNNAQASAFGNLFNFVQQAGWTNTEGAVNTARLGLLNNSLSGDKLVIDVSTDGDPTICDGGTNSSFPNCAAGQTPESEAIAAANLARDSNITVNALGVGSSISASFLNALVGVNPADTPTGFFVLAPNYDAFQASLEEKLGREIIGVSEPTSLVLLASGLAGLAGMTWRARRRT